MANAAREQRVTEFGLDGCEAVDRNRIVITMISITGLIIRNLFANIYLKYYILSAMKIVFYIFFISYNNEGMILIDSYKLSLADQYPNVIP